MTRKMTEWPSKRGPITKIMPSDRCKRDTVPLAVDQWYDFHEFGCHLGNVGLARPLDIFGPRTNIQDKAPTARDGHEMDDTTRTELEAAVYRRLVQHLRTHAGVQNIDLMNLAGFCRNCLSKWYAAAAEERGLDIDKEAAREIIYGMPYDEWRAKHQTEASPEKQAAWEERQKTLEH